MRIQPCRAPHGRDIVGTREKRLPCSIKPPALTVRAPRATDRDSTFKNISPISKPPASCSASIRRSTRTPNCIRWCAGNSSAACRRKSAAPFVFTNVADAKGRKYDIPVVVGALAASPQIYAIGMGRKVEEIGEAWMARDRAPDCAGHGRVCAVPGGRDHGRRSESAGRRSPHCRCQSRRPASTRRRI